MIFVQQLLHLRSLSVIVFLRHEHTRIVHLAGIFADGGPPSTVVCENHGVVVVEGEDDVLVVLRNLQIFDSLVTLPQVASNYQCTLRFTLAQCLMNLYDELVPLLVVVGNGLVHELVCHGVVAVALQHIRQLIPHLYQVLLRLL